MNNTYYVELLNCIITETPPSQDAVSAIPLQKLYDFCSLNKLIPLMANHLSHWPCLSKEDNELVTWWKNEATRLVFLEYRKLSLIKELTKEAKSRGISLLFFKGYQLALLYPNFALRNSSDTDILVDKTQFAQAVALLKELQYTHDDSSDTENVYTFLYKEDGYTVHKIELHTSLYEDACGQQLSCLEGLALDAAEKNISSECCGMQLLTLGHTEHFIYQIFHMVKHLGCHGFPARYLLDTALFVKAYSQKIKWDTVLAAMDKLGYSVFYRMLCSIMIHHFAVPDVLLGGMASFTPAECDGLLTDILHFGARSFGDELSNHFYYFEQYIELLERKNKGPLDTISFDGGTVPAKIVPRKAQESKDLQHRIRLLQKLQLI